MAASCGRDAPSCSVVVQSIFRLTVGDKSDKFQTVTGQLADKPTRGQSSRGLVNSPTSQLAEMFDL